MPSKVTVTLVGRGAASVARSAAGMMQKLRENDHKPGWEACSPWYLLDRTKEELEELIEEIAAFLGPNVSFWSEAERVAFLKRIRREAWDAQNMLMMICDWVDRLLPDKEVDDLGEPDER